MRRRAQEASYGPDGDGARMVLPLRRQCGNIWNRNESHVPFSEWTISMSLSVCLRSHTSGMTSQAPGHFSTFICVFVDFFFTYQYFLFSPWLLLSLLGSLGGCLRWSQLHRNCTSQFLFQRCLIYCIFYQDDTLQHIQYACYKFLRFTLHLAQTGCLMTLSHMATCHHLEWAKERRDLAGKQTPVAFVPLTLSAWQISISSFSVGW